MSKILAVFGATGQQGGSVVDYVLQDPELSLKFKIRAITRDVDSDKSKQLKEKNVEVVQGDALDRASLEKALTGVDSVFAMTTPDFSPDGFNIEFNAGKAIAEVAVEKGVKYIIFSTLPSIKDLSGGKYTKVSHFESKAAVEKYIRGLSPKIKSAFFSPGAFAQNFHGFPMFIPQKLSEDTWGFARSDSPKAEIPIIDVVGDTGKWIGAILAEPDKYEGKTFTAATALYTNEEIAATMSKVTGKNVVYKQISVEDWRAGLPFAADAFTETFAFMDEFGYYGKDTDKAVAWAAENARGKLATLEDYLRAHPIKLE